MSWTKLKRAIYSWISHRNHSCRRYYKLIRVLSRQWNIGATLASLSGHPRLGHWKLPGGLLSPVYRLFVLLINLKCRCSRMNLTRAAVTNSMDGSRTAAPAASMHRGTKVFAAEELAVWPFTFWLGGSFCCRGPLTNSQNVAPHELWTTHGTFR